MPGHKGDAVEFSGNERYEMPSDSALETPDAYTVAAWLFPMALPVDLGCAVTKVYGLGAQNAWTLCIATDASFFFETADHELTTDGMYGARVPLDSWHHMAAVWTGSV